MADETNLQSFLNGLEDEGFLVNPSTQVLEGVVESDASDGLRIIASGDVIRSITNDFTTTASLVDQIENSNIKIREENNLPESMYFVSSDHLAVLIETACGITTLSKTLDSESNFNKAADLFSNGVEPDFRTPSHTTIRETLASQFSEQLAADFEEVFAELDETSSDFSETALVLLLAAKNNELLYEISKWGEDTKLASKATFSRVKSQLEEDGYIETEKVPIDVGRPRLRLTLSENTSINGTDDIVTALVE